MNKEPVKISVVHTPDYQQETIDQAVEKHFSALGLQNQLNAFSKVVLKPNLLMKRSPETATTTHPSIMTAVIRWLEKQGVLHVTVADSPGGLFTTGALHGVYASTGMEQAVNGTTALLNYNVKHSVVPHPAGVLCREFEIIDAILEADIIINLPKLKTHGMMQLSAAVKNLFGAVPGLQKPELHFRFPKQDDFAQMLVDLSTLVKPTITLVDAVVSMEGEGPSAGTPRQTQMTFASCDLHALDVFICAYTKIPVTTAFTVQKSLENALALPHVEDYEYLNDGYPQPLENFLLPSSKPINLVEHLPRWLHRPANAVAERFFTPRPVIKTKKCIGCGKCEESCAPKAVLVKNKRAKIDDSMCIKCYCCHEMCPVKAIEIKRGAVLSRF